MKFVRQFAAVLVVVAVVALIGITWDRIGPASLPGEGPTGSGFGKVVNVPAGKAVPGGKVVDVPAGPGGPLRAPPGTRIGGGAIPVDVGDLLQPANLVVFRNTVVLEAEIMAGVVVLGIGARKWRRARRRVRLAAPPDHHRDRRRDT